jgi:site-specific DNA-methyltransferase (adenine-specific)
MKPYYEHAGITIYHGDCREVLPTLKEKAGLLATDPPFNVPVKYQAAEGDYPRSWGDLVVMEPFFREVFQVIRKATREDGQVYICCDDDSYPVFFKVAYSIWPQSQMLIWYKPTGRRGRGWLHSYELILHPRAQATAYADDFRQDVIGIMPVRTLNRMHPAEKPGDLWDHLASGMPTRDFVLVDPFMGGGAALAWAKARGIRAIGIDCEEAWCEVAAKRLSQQVLDFAPAEQKTAPEQIDLLAEVVP